MYVLLGSNGQITSQLARRLLAAGHPVRVVGRSATSLAPLAEAGAQVVVGDPADPARLVQAFTGATAAFTMIPPCYAAPVMRVAQDRIGESIARALSQVPVPRVVNLSSIGAELARGTGPIEALHAQEQRLDALPGIDLLHLRPGSFMENLLPAVQEIEATGTLPGLEAAEAPIPMVATRDIVTVAARELTQPSRRGVVLLQAPRPVSMNEAAAAFGSVLGRPDLRYTQVEPSAMKAVLLAQGLSADAADQLDILARWLSTAALDSATAGPRLTQPTTFEIFARESLAQAVAH